MTRNKFGLPYIFDHVKAQDQSSIFDYVKHLKKMRKNDKK